jgi:hypothetical protein
MMELEEPAFGAPAFGAHEGALTAIALPYLPPDSCRNVTGAALRRLACARLCSGSNLCPFKVGEQDSQGSIEYRCHVAIRNRVTQEIPNSPQFVMRLTTDGHLHFEALRSERRNN